MRRTLSNLISIGLIFTITSCSKAPSTANIFTKYSGDAAGRETDPDADNDTGSDPVDSIETDPGTDPESEVELPASFLPSVTSITVTNAKGEAPKKGDSLKVTVKLENKGAKEGEIKYYPTLSGTRFTDFENVPLATVTAALKASEKKDLSFDIPAMIENSTNSKRFALGRGAYKLSGQLEIDGKKIDLAAAKDFEIAKGPGVFVLVLADKRYFGIAGAKGSDPEKWVVETMTRKSSVWNQKTASKKMYPGGFDEILGIKHIVKVVDTLDSKDDGSDVFDKPEALATSWLGLTKKWEHGSGPGTNKHGYDYFIALDFDMWGGVTFGAAQVSGVGDQSKDRMQVILVHESGHVFGAPHCDPIQGYVMCSGEKNDAYKESGEFVWLDDSVARMKNIFE